MSANPTAKVLFRVPDDEGGATVETLWATSLGDDRYKLDNSPFYAYGVSWEDIVLAPFDAQEGMATFQSVFQKSGNRTIRIIFDPPVSTGNSSDRVLQDLVGTGCSYVGANRKYISINIPPGSDLQEIRRFLIANEAQWEHADPTSESFHEEEG